MNTVHPLREEMRNRLLRRVDWRFLLPNPCPEKTMCLAKDELADAVALISKRVVFSPSDAQADCELGVAIEPDKKMLGALWQALRPGGVLYMEWYSPLRANALNIRRHLGASGFEEMELYFAWPPPPRGQPQFWLPLQAPGALRYFLSHRPRDKSRRHQIARKVLQELWRALVRLGVDFPVSALARKPEYRNALSRSIVESANREVHGLAHPCSSLLLTGGRRSINKIVRVVFEDRTEQPSAVIKSSRVAESQAGLLREMNVLNTLAAFKPDIQGVPRVLFCREHCNSVSVGETVLTGVPVYSVLNQSNLHDIARRATEWLTELPRTPRPVPKAHWWDRLIEPVLGDFHASFTRVLDEGMFDETRAILESLGDLSLVCEQRDFSPWNVHIATSGELFVLDWESAELEGLPALDLIYFLTYLCFFHDGALESGHIVESYRNMLNPTTQHGRAWSECVGHYLSELGIDSVMLRPLRLFAWLLHSRSEVQQLIADEGGAPSLDALRRSLFFTLWQQELGATL